MASSSARRRRASQEAVGGGNLLVLGRSHRAVSRLRARGQGHWECRRYRAVPRRHRRSGSKVGAKYKGKFASTNDAFCPTLRLRSKRPCPRTSTALEIVIDGLTSKAVADAMRAGLKTVANGGAREGITRITAGNYGGKLGQHHYHLKEIVA